MFSSYKLPMVCRTLSLLAVLIVAGCASPEEKAQGYYERGTKLLSQQDYIKASIEFRNAIQLKKNMVGAWRGLLEIETHNKNYQSLIPILRNIVELDPQDVEAKLKLGQYLMASNANDQAFEMANGAVELAPKNANAVALRAAVLLKLNDASGAKRDAEAARVLDPKNAAALLVLSAEQASHGDLPGALATIDRDAASHEKDLGVQLFKLSLLERAGDLKGLERLIKKLVADFPKENVFPKTLVKLYLKQNRLDDAENELRGLADADPSDVEANLDVVRFLQQAKGPDAAREELVTRIKANGSVFKYQLALAEFDFGRGSTGEAMQQLEKLISSGISAENTVLAQLKLAQFQISLKKYDAAEPIVAEVLRKDARNVEALKLRAGIRIQKGEVDSAIADLREGLNDQPRSSELMQLLATAYERSGSIELAEKQYADATKASNFDPATTLNYVSFLRRRGNIERAEDALNELVQHSPRNIAALSALAEVRLARQNWIGAQEIADTIQKLGGGAGTADQILAAALSGKGNYNESIQILEKAQTEAPGAVPPLVGLVGTMVRGQQLDRAVTFLQTILKQSPSNAEAHVLLGSVLLLKNSPAEAVQSFKAAITQQPKLAAGYLALANYHTRERNLVEAEKVLRGGLEQLPDDFATRMALAGVLELKGDYDGAIAEYETLFKQQSASLVVANNLASMLTQYRTDKASLDRAASIAAVLRKSPLPAFKDTLGWISYLRGEIKASIPLLEEAAALLPDRDIIQYHLGMSYLADGQLDKASEKFTKALSLQPDPGLAAKIRAAQEKTVKPG